MAHTIQYMEALSGKAPKIVSILEGTSETFKKGSIVVYDNSEDGVVEQALTAGVPNAVVAWGIALADATNVTSGFAEIPVQKIRPGDIFSCAVASDQDTLAAPVIDHRGDKMGIIKLSTTGGDGTEWAADTGETNWVKVVDLDPRDVARRGSAAGLTAGDRILFTFLNTVVDSDGAIA